MKQGKTLYVSDLDGTLLQPDARISDRTLSMLNEAISKGALFTIATARTPATVASIIENLDLRLPAVVMTGTALWDKTSNTYSDVKFMADKPVKELVNIYRATHYPTFLYTLRQDMIHIYHLGPLSEIERNFIEERRHNFAKTLHIPADGESELPDYLGYTVLFYGMQPDAKTEEVFKLTSKVKDVRVQKYHDFYGPEIGILEAFSPLSTKAIAIRELASRLGVERIVTFGDNLNDIPMLELADVGVAMENGVDEVKAVADIVIGRNTEDAVAKFILDDMGIDRGGEQ
ncbi:MAG: Cof-type HAD-IIB family hydrolase [Muribaculaceae bacterium]|nr:Cof-type HAD-IIB family hydrolase [Muribaculaceae bacterium]